MFGFPPWRFLIKHAAQRYGVLDPSTIMARIRRFAQPSEVAEPIELLRAGILFHARGLVNTKAIQHNMDWVWPYWVERQFNPTDPSFVPRAFSFSHINLTHRNWTAVGLPGGAIYPIIDPRGLVTPLHDGWSLDFWIITDSRRRLLPSKLPHASVGQKLLLEPNLRVETRSSLDAMKLTVATEMVATHGQAELRNEVTASSDETGWLVVAVRPYNPEGVQFIDRIRLDEEANAFQVNDKSWVRLSMPPDGLRMAHYAEGDVYFGIPGDGTQHEVTCKAGMATAAALFRLEAGNPRTLEVFASLEPDVKAAGLMDTGLTWSSAVQGLAKLQVNDPQVRFLYDAAVRTLMLLSARDVVPGPYTYRRFWFRDACLMLQPMIAIGMVDRAARMLGEFPARQQFNGYFLSQEGEWDSNGQVLWIASRFAKLTGQALDATLLNALTKGMRWLARKRLKADKPAGTQGLLPAGFSAEHLGPNDYYYWDDFWAWGGLRSFAHYCHHHQHPELAAEAQALVDEFRQAIEASIAGIPQRRSQGAIPAAPGRRLDAGAVGSMVADYPLRLYPPNDSRIAATLEFLLDRCFQQGGFFQEMIHSGINAYLTLDLVQTLMRNGDARFARLLRRVAELASPTGQWPEAIHPLTFGGCMGDGQHGWAAAEWVMMIRNGFVREEDDALILGSGILDEWLDEGVSFGPTLTDWGEVTVSATREALTIEARWRVNPPPCIRIAVPGYQSVSADVTQTRFPLQRP